MVSCLDSVTLDVTVVLQADAPVQQLTQQLLPDLGMLSAGDQVVQLPRVAVQVVQLLDLAQKILRGDQAPPAVYIKHIMVDRTNIGDYYPEN